jgi:hypothetical protein
MPLKMLLHMLLKLIIVRKLRAKFPKFTQKIQRHMKIVETKQMGMPNISSSMTKVMYCTLIATINICLQKLQGLNNA